MTPAQHHGGPYPATTHRTHLCRRRRDPALATSDHLSDTPGAVLPPPLQESNALDLPCLINGPREFFDRGRSSV